MNYRLLAVAALLAAAILYCRGPSARRVVADTRLVVAEGSIEYRGKRYAAEWGEPVTHQGDLRRIGRARYRFAPFFTHHVVVTTGDFSDPDRVAISPFRGGSIVWSARTRPEGSLIVLHLLPADASVLADVARLEAGDCARFSGREESDSRIVADDGGYARLTSANHRYLLVDLVQACP